MHHEGTHTHINISMFDTNVTATWADHIEQVCLEVRGRESRFSWQQSIEEAESLRDQLTAAIEAAKAGA